MFMNAIVLSGAVVESKFYDSLTGAEKQPGYVVELTVLDENTTEKYVCQFTGGFQGLEDLKELKRQGAALDVLHQRVAELEARELPPQMSKFQFEVLKLKGKQVAFLKLACRFVQVASPVGA
jgi:hypothetical protein